MNGDLVGQVIAGCTVLEVFQREGRRFLRVDSHCPICGIREIRLDRLRRMKYPCIHSVPNEERLKQGEKSKQKYQRMMREHAESWVGKDTERFHVQGIVTETPFKPKPSRTYVCVTCLVCGHKQVIDGNRIEKAKCTKCAIRARRPSGEHGGITAQYPRLHSSLKRHWQKCYDPNCDGYYLCGGKGWHFDERWIRYVNGKRMLNTRVAIEDCVAAGWDESNPRMILEKDKLAIELGERVIGRQTIRCVDRSENYLYRFDSH